MGTPHSASCRGGMGGFIFKYLWARTLRYDALPPARSERAHLLRHSDTSADDSHPPCALPSSPGARVLASVGYWFRRRAPRVRAHFVRPSGLYMSASILMHWVLGQCAYPWICWVLGQRRNRGIVQTVSWAPLPFIEASYTPTYWDRHIHTPIMNTTHT